MKAQTSVTKLLSIALLSALCPFATLTAAAQEGAQPAKPQTLKLVSADTLRGKQLLDAGDAEGAEKVLRSAARRNARDSAAWHYLGLALAREGKTSDARFALERAVDLRNEAFNLEFNLQRVEEGDLSKEEGDARRLRFAAATRELAESIESFVAVAHEDEELWREWLATLAVYAQLAADPKFDTKPFNLARLATRAVVTHKSEPSYTEEARQHNVEGKIMLRVLLGDDGTIKGVTVVKGLPHGLTENCIKVARRITFTPATVEGRPVSQLVVVEYNFDIY